MAEESFRISEVLPASPELVYATWLSSVGHAEMTGAGARVVPGVGGRFSAWDGYIWGITLELEPNHRIVQSWRTLEFPGTAPDSRLEVLLQPTPEGCRITLAHSRIPAGQAESYRQGWYDHYFDPMRAYFSRLAGRGTKKRPKARRKPSRRAKTVTRPRKAGKKAGPVRRKTAPTRRTSTPRRKGAKKRR